MTQTNAPQAAPAPPPAVPTAVHGSGETAGPPPSPPPPQGPRQAVIIAALAAGALALIIGIAFGDSLRAGFGRAWTAAFGDARSQAGPIQYYTCGMHPWVILPAPGDCPICHMKLTPIDPTRLTGGVTIDPVIVQNMGVRIEPVTRGPLVKRIRTVGSIDYAEPLVRDVSTRVEGWIESLNVDSVGEQVSAGQVLFEIYSPELYAAQEEYLLALRAVRNAGGSPTPSQEQILGSAHTRLMYYDIAPEDIAAIENSGSALRAVPVRSPHYGYVTEKNAFEGMKVDKGMRVYRVADLSKVWVMVTAYEYQLPYLTEGQDAEMTLPYIPGQVFRGKVIYLYPYLNQQTRQVRMRLEFDNPSGLLRPGMFANVELQSTLADQRILAPRSAIIDTGLRQVAYVSLGRGRFEPREVELGVETEDGLVEIRGGLEPGDQVVTSGQFLLDSEATIRESLARLIQGQQASEQAASAAPTTSPASPPPLPAEASASFASILGAYLTIGQQLAADSTSGIADEANRVIADVQRMESVAIPGNEHFWHSLEAPAAIREHSQALSAAADLAAARLAYADLSLAVAKLAKAIGVPVELGQDLHELHCPMYREGQGGGVWVQGAGAVHNPYFGTSMLECFDQRLELPRAGSSAAPTTRRAGSST